MQIGFARQGVLTPPCPPGLWITTLHHCSTHDSSHVASLKRKEKFTLFSDYNGSLLRQQPRAVASLANNPEPLNSPISPC